MRVAFAATAVLLLAGLVVVPLLVDRDDDPARPAAAGQAAPAATSRVPGLRRWEADVRRALRGSTPALRARVARGGPEEERAIVLDIDNTAMQTFYRRGEPTVRVLRLAREADRLGVAVLFATGRTGEWAEEAGPRLARAGYPVDGLCSRERGERVDVAKARCRAEFAAEGYRLVFNVGNLATDFVGGGCERAWRLPSYGGALD